MSDIIKSVQDFYDEAGSHFSRTRQKTYGTSSSNWRVTDRYIGRLKPGQRVLDLGCGNGKLISGLPAGTQYIGTDFSQSLLSEAAKLYPNHDFRLGNVLDPEHWDNLGKFEAIFCVAVLHHIPEKDQQIYVMRQIKEHLAPGGFLYLTVWNLSQEKFAQYRVGDHYEVPYNKKWKRYCVPYDTQSMTTLMSEAGLFIEEIFYADRTGDRIDQSQGQNLVVVAKLTQG